MFGSNEIVGRSYFAKAEDRLFVTSMFMTLQGEGPLRGEPAFFVRLARCNLACFFCDTFFEGGDWFSIDDLLDRISYKIAEYFKWEVPTWASVVIKDVYRNDDIVPRHMALVLTGGEPTLQVNIIPLLERASKLFEKTQIESNGVQFLAIPDSTIYVVSPKCLEHDSKPVRYLEPNAQVLDRADCLKFVMEADPESPYSDIPEWALRWRDRTHRAIFVSPMNRYLQEPQKARMLKASGLKPTLEQRSTDQEIVSFWEPDLLDMTANQANHEYVARYAIQHGLTYNLQQHLFASLA